MTEKLESIVNSTTATAITRAAQVSLVPIMLWFGSNMMDVKERLGKVEQTINDKMPDVFPKGEAALALAAVGNRIDSNSQSIRDMQRRLEALETARNRLR